MLFRPNIFIRIVHLYFHVFLMLLCCKGKAPVGHFDRGVCKCNARWCSLLSTPGGGEHFQGVSKNIIPCLNVDFNTMEMDEKLTFQKAHCRSPVGRCCLSILTFSLDLTPVKRRIPRSGLALEMASNNALYLQWSVSLYQRDLEKNMSKSSLQITRGKMLSLNSYTFLGFDAPQGWCRGRVLP